MGQRTQICIVSTDKHNNHRVEVYHDQWGIGRRMPMASMALIAKIYDSNKYDYRNRRSIFLDNCKLEGNFNISHEYTLDYNANGDLVSVKTDCFKKVGEMGYRRYWGKVKSKSALATFPQKFEDWNDTNVNTYKDFVDGHCDNNNGIMVIFCTEKQDPECEWNNLYGYTIGFMEGYEDDCEVGLAFERFLSVDEWASISINRRYMEAEDFLGMYKRFLEWNEVATFPSEQKETVKA